MARQYISTKVVETFIIKKNKDPIRKLWLHRFYVLFLTFLAYTIYHMSRKPMSVVKSKLFNGNISDPENWAPFDGRNANNLLSLLDGTYWGTYAIGMFAVGYVAERSDLRYFLSISMSLVGILNIISGMAYYLHIHSLAFFVILQVLTGLIEATGWPAVLAVIGSWFGSKTKKGLIFGIWSLHTSAGNMLGTAVAGAFVDHHWGLSFIVPGIICVIFSLVTFVFLIPKPGDIDLKVDETILEDDRTHQTKDENNNKEQAISFWGALMIPGVIEFSICLFFTKSVSYIFLNWLPKFISSNNGFSSSESAYISIMFDIGGSVGSIIVGLLADFTDCGATVCIAFLMMAIPSLYMLGNFSKLGMVINLILQFLAGFFINGPYSLITTAVSANLAHQVPSKAATATVSAIIDGTGSIGAAVGPAVTGPLYDNFSWNSVFYLCMIGDFIAACCLIRLAWSEVNNRIRSYKNEHLHRRQSESSANNSLSSNDDDRKNIVKTP